MVKIYVEGGGDAASLRTACREGFSNFLEKAGFKGKMPKIIACGGRNNAYDSFCTALKNGDKALLLVDSEEPISADFQRGDSSQAEIRKQWMPWQHLATRKGDEWKKPHDANDAQCHLMVQCMEAWLLADRETLKSFFGQGFMETQLPNISNAIETVPKQKIYDSLKNATKNCKTKSPYGKGEHSFKLLAQMDPQKVLDVSPWAKRFIEAIAYHT